MKRQNSHNMVLGGLMYTVANVHATLAEGGWTDHLQG